MEHPSDGCEDRLPQRIIEEEVYIEQPQGFEVHDRETHVCRLKKALYGLKQAPRAWYSRIDSILQGMGFTKSEADPNLYFLLVGSEILILVLYVDDLILTGAESLIAGCKSDLASEFEMKDIGPMHYFLGLEVWQRSGEIFLGQGKYTLEILKRFRMEDSRPMATPMVTNLKKIDSSDFRVGRLQTVQAVDWLVDVSGQHSTRHLLLLLTP
jgi:hypothetical protein